MPKRCDTVLQDNRTGMDRKVGEIQIATSGSGPPRIAPTTGPDSPHRFAIGREVDFEFKMAVQFVMGKQPAATPPALSNEPADLGSKVA